MQLEFYYGVTILDEPTRCPLLQFLECQSELSKSLTRLYFIHDEGATPCEGDISIAYVSQVTPRGDIIITNKFNKTRTRTRNDRCHLNFISVLVKILVDSINRF